MTNLFRGILRRLVYSGAATPLLVLVAGAAAAQSPARVSGLVRGESGDVLSAAAVALVSGDSVVRRVETDRNGRYTIDSVVPGRYVLEFRHIGFVGVRYAWVAADGVKADVNALLSNAKSTLDPVRVYATEDTVFRRSAAVRGRVLDTEHNPIADAIVDVIGLGAAGTTRDDGGFLFKPVLPGANVIRIRKIGYEPATATLDLQVGEERDLVVLLDRLPTNLAAAVVRDRSGFGVDSLIWSQLDRRLRWHGIKNFIVGPNDLPRYSGNTLDIVMRQIGVDFAERRIIARAPQITSLNPSGTRQRMVGSLEDFAVDGSACILFDGRRAAYQPLTTIRADDIELLEVYPSRAEPTTTVAEYMHGPCQMQSNGDHRTYYVVWLKR